MKRMDDFHAAGRPAAFFREKLTGSFPALAFSVIQLTISRGILYPVESVILRYVGMPRLHQDDMCSGPLFKKILLFSLPIMAMNLLQLLFNAADMIVVGQFSGKEALAAVGATGALINLIINTFMGLSVGTSVVVAQDYGAQDWNGVSRSVHTSILLSIIGGL